MQCEAAGSEAYQKTSRDRAHVLDHRAMQWYTAMTTL
jgi:hypothetical protein